MFTIQKAADVNVLVQGGPLYWAFPFSKGSLLLGNFVNLNKIVFAWAN